MAINALIAQGVRPIGADLPQIAGMLQEKRQAESRNALMQQESARQQQQADQQNQLFNQGQEKQKLTQSLALAQYAAQPGVNKAQIERDVPDVIAGFEQLHGPGSWASATEEQVSASAQDAVRKLSAHLGIGPAKPKYEFKEVNGRLIRTDENAGTGTVIGNYSSNKLGAPVAGIDPVTKKPILMRYGDSSTDGVPVGNQLPTPAQPRHGMSVTTSDGTSIQIGGDGSPVDLSKATRTNIEGDFVKAQANLSNISDISAQWKTEFSTWAGQGQQLIAAIRDKSGIAAAKLSPDDKQHLSDYSTWKSSANSALSAYLNQLSGAAISPNEEQRLRAGFPNDQDGPTEFKAKVDATAKRFAMVQARAAYMLANPSIKMDSVSIDGMQGIILGEANKLSKAYTDRGMDAEAARQRAIAETRGRFGIGNAK